MSDGSGRHETVRIPVLSATGKPSVLVVDDEPALARTIQRLLTTADYEVVVAPSAAAAVELLVGRGFDVVLTDIQMPEMSGVDLLRVVRTYDLDVPVILMTGDPTVESAMEAVALGALQYLAKPVSNDTLLNTVKRATQLHRLAQVKRDALRVSGIDDGLAGDRAGREVRFTNALATMFMAFQPIVDCRSNRVFGYEALMRTREPSFPHPGAVLSAAEALGRLPDLGRKVRALSAEKFSTAPPDTLLFVNLHTRDLLDPALFEPSDPLRAFASRVVLEITEREAVHDIKDIQARIAVLRYNGFRIAIDDLGAGYAGLSSFVALEPEIIKLDMSLIRNIHDSPVRQQIVGSMASLGKQMGMRVVAEGVEVEAERETVESLGCDLQQGYLFAKPGPPFPRVSGFLTSR